ncbi:hypothetical protein J4Q44_G00300830 [Coregonus suidteri]|uniref:Uncharacterized protein n=1 Tax=Coregonus suidteri TaxID=861788 RepID=A0AAN8QCJ9_9TELE
MAKISLLRVLLNERLTAAADEIFGAVEKTVAEYQEEITRSKEENEKLRKLLDIVLKPVIKLHRADLQQLTLPVSEKVLLSSSTVRRSGAPVWGWRTQSPHRFMNRSSGPVMGESIFMLWSPKTLTLYSLLLVSKACVRIRTQLSLHIFTKPKVRNMDREPLYQAFQRNRSKQNLMEMDTCH